MGKRLDEIAGRHFPWLCAAGVVLCDACSGVGESVLWPCDAAILLMHIARREQVQEPGTEA